MLGTPLVSILVPIYNVEDYIERCARSVFEQTYQNLEYVFVDDGTPDASIDILKKVIEDYPNRKDCIRIIRHEQNKGLAAARNTAIASCHGDYILHVDSDDWLEYDAVELLAQCQQETDADIVYTNGYYCHKQESYKVNCRAWFTDKEMLLKSFLQDKATISIWSKLIKKSLYTDNNIKCDERGCYYEDFQVLSRLIYYSQKIVCLDAFIYHYDRSNPSSIVMNIPHSIDIQRQGLLSIQVVRDFFQDKEQHYFDLVNLFYLKYLHRMLNTNCRYKNRKGYGEFLNLLSQSERRDWQLIGWDKPWNRMIDSNYYIKLFLLPFWQTKQKAVSLFKRFL